MVCKNYMLFCFLKQLAPGLPHQCICNLLRVALRCSMNLSKLHHQRLILGFPFLNSWQALVDILHQSVLSCLGFNQVAFNAFPFDNFRLVCNRKSSGTRGTGSILQSWASKLLPVKSFHGLLQVSMLFLCKLDFAAVKLHCVVSALPVSFLHCVKGIHLFATLTNHFIDISILKCLLHCLLIGVVVAVQHNRLWETSRGSLAISLVSASKKRQELRVLSFHLPLSTPLILHKEAVEQLCFFFDFHKIPRLF